MASGDREANQEQHRVAVLPMCGKCCGSMGGGHDLGLRGVEALVGLDLGFPHLWNCEELLAVYKPARLQYSCLSLN